MKNEVEPFLHFTSDTEMINFDMTDISSLFMGKYNKRKAGQYIEKFMNSMEIYTNVNHSNTIIYHKLASRYSDSLKID